MTWVASNIKWCQSDDITIEIHLPLSLPKCISSRDVDVFVSQTDTDVVCVKVRHTILWQARLYAAVSKEIDWHIENGKTLIIEVIKRVPEDWTALLNVPLPSKVKLPGMDRQQRNPFFLTKTQLDQRLQLELPPFPVQWVEKTRSDALKKTTEDDFVASNEVSNKEGVSGVSLEEVNIFDKKGDKLETYDFTSISRLDDYVKAHIPFDFETSNSSDSKEELNEAELVNGTSSGLTFPSSCFDYKSEIKIAEEDVKDDAFVKAVHQLAAIINSNQGEDLSNDMKTETTSKSEQPTAQREEEMVEIPKIPDLKDFINEMNSFINIGDRSLGKLRSKEELKDQNEKVKEEKNEEKLNEKEEKNDEKLEEKEEKNEEKLGENKEKLDEKEENKEEKLGENKEEKLGEKEENLDGKEEKNEEKLNEEEKKEEKLCEKEVERNENLVEKEEKKEKNIKKGEDIEDEKNVNDIKLPCKYSLHKIALKSEFEAMCIEAKHITERQNELKEKMNSLNDTECEEYKTAKRNIELTSLMLEYNKAMLTLRTRPSVIENFLKIIFLDINKARANIGETSNKENEEYLNEDEKKMTGMDLFTLGLKRNQIDGIHYFRLAAIHKRHSPSVLALYSLYNGTKSSYVRGVQILLINALHNTFNDSNSTNNSSEIINLSEADIDARINARVGDLFNSGRYSIPSLWTMSVFFQQRAALVGCTHAMVTLFQLHLNGSASGATMPSSVLSEAFVNKALADYFLNCAIRRGCISAYLIKSSRYALLSKVFDKAAKASTEKEEKIEGEGKIYKDNATAIIGIKKNYIALSRKYYEFALAAQPSLKSYPDMPIIGMITMKELHDIIYLEGNEKNVKKKAQENKSIVNGDNTLSKIKEKDQGVSNDNLTFKSEPSTRADAASRIAKIERLSQQQGAAGPPMMPSKSSIVSANSGNGFQKFWERTTKFLLGTYAIYCVSFPLRVMILPYFYEFVSNFMDKFGIKNTPIDGSMSFRY